MKITRLEIKEYKQFKDLTLDLTYPLGHQKAGEPLDKICIIGQSGVGKTNILEIIKEKKSEYFVKAIFTENNSNREKIYVSEVKNNCILNKKETNPIEVVDNFFTKVGNFIVPFISGIILLAMYFIITMNINDKNTIDEQIKLFKSLFIIWTFTALLGILFLIIKELFQNKINNKYKIFKEYMKSKKYIILNENAWYLLKEQVNNYSKEIFEYKGILSDKLLNFEDYDKKDFLNDMKIWEYNNQNILEEIASKVNDIVIKFNLELTKINKNQKSYNDLIFKDLSNGNIIKYDDLSTGTKNIISTFIPLKIHNPKDSIILIDEPENSFYPDIQRKLTELYMEVGENNQLIMATHSPLIASSFEPWEVVELKFDEDTHQIYRELYYDSENDERHIDNYTLDPRMLTWTGILTQIFDLKEDSNFEIREKALMQYIRLERDIEKIEDKKEKMQKFEELMKLSERLGLSDNEKN